MAPVLSGFRKRYFFALGFVAAREVFAPQPTKRKKAEVMKDPIHISGKEKPVTI
jgi:hypothetical protein